MTKHILKLLVPLTILFLSACDSKNKVVEGPFLTKYSKLYSQDTGKLVTGTVKKYYEHTPELLESTTVYRNGLKNGEYRLYYTNGQLRESGTFVDGKLDGVYEEFWGNGQLSGKAIYSQGVIINDEKYHESGELKKKTNFKNGLKSGEVKIYYSNGNVGIEEFYKNDELEGIRRTYTRNGIIESKIQYRGGKKITVLECDLDEKRKYEKINMFACIDLSNEILSWDIN